MAHVLSDQEICERYKKSKDKKFEVMLMAEIEEKTQDDIIAILKKNHVVVDDPRKPGRPKKHKKITKKLKLITKKLIFLRLFSLWWRIILSKLARTFKRKRSSSLSCISSRGICWAS